MSNIILEYQPAFIEAKWRAPKYVHALTTLSTPGYSSTPGYRSFNLGAHTQDDTHSVTLNRLMLHKLIKKPIVWLNQQHSNTVVSATHYSPNTVADASITTDARYALAVLTADCVPIVLSSPCGTKIAAIHAGWRGLASDIIAHTVRKMHTEHLHAWIGPCISWPCYPVGHTLRNHFLQKNNKLSPFFKLNQAKWHADLTGIAAFLLKDAGVNHIDCANLCTQNTTTPLFSARKNGLYSGRIATCIWIDHDKIRD